MVQKTFSKTAKGVDVRLTGDIRKTELETMALECSSGQCSCSCDSGIQELVKGIHVSGDDGDVVLSLEGQGLDPDSIADAMEQCDLNTEQ